MAATTSTRRPDVVTEPSIARDRLPTELGDEPLEPTEVLIKQARRRQRRRWAVSALVLALVGGLVAGVVANSGSPPPPRPPGAHHAVSARELRADARGIATCATLGVSITPAWGPPTRGAPGITAVANRGFSIKALSLIDRYLPSNCSSAQYWAPRGGRLTLVVQFPLQLTRHARDVLAAGDLTYLGRTGAVTSMRYTASPIACPPDTQSSIPRSPLCWAGLPPGSSG